MLKQNLNDCFQIDPKSELELEKKIGDGDVGDEVTLMTL